MNYYKPFLLAAVLAALATRTVAQHWNLTGNSGTDTSQYIGTSDAQSLRFRVHNQKSGFIDVSNGSTALGYHAGLSMKGGRNTAMGYSALMGISTASGNSAFGFQALAANTGGYANTAVGDQALRSNTIGNYNTAVGKTALMSSLDGNFNTALGFYALTTNANGSSNTAVGYSALGFNSAGLNNTATGVEAAILNATGMGNSAYGAFSLYMNTAGNFNSIFGYYGDVTTAGLNHATAIGAGAIVNASYKVVLGTPSTGSNGGYQNWSSFSDARFKRQVREDVPGLTFIRRLKPVTYVLDVSGLHQYYERLMEVHVPADKKEAWKRQRAQLQTVSPAIAAMVRTGFVAQEVEKAAREIGYDFSGVDRPADGDGLYALRYSEFVPPLVKAVQEQQAVIEELQAANKTLKEEQATLLKRLEKLESLTGGAARDTARLVANEQSRLHTETDKLVATGTYVTYTLPKSGMVTMKLYDARGTELRVVEQTRKEKGRYTVFISTDNLAPGNYYYWLSLDEELLFKKPIRL